jgi:tripartite-type tricarboxylate transporter receptor subunit TctC
MKSIAALCCVLLLSCGYPAQAEEYPVKPIRWIVPFPPGGGTDIVARILGQKLSETLGQQVVIDNRGGAGSMVGTEIAARSAPDGYTQLFATAAGTIINPLLNPNISYDPVKDFAPVTLLVVNPQLLVVNSSVPINSVKELIAYAKANPGKLNYGSSGKGAANHLCMELLKSMAGIDMVHVPYKGAGPAITDLLGGSVQLMFNPMPPLLPLVKAGKLRALAVGDAQRSPAMPDIPTVAEGGVPGYEYVLWYGLFAPAKTPKNIIGKLNAQLAKILADPEMVQRLMAQGADPRSTTPEALGQFMREDTERLKKVIRAAGIKAE